MGRGGLQTRWLLCVTFLIGSREENVHLFDSRSNVSPFSTSGDALCCLVHSHPPSLWPGNSDVSGYSISVKQIFIKFVKEPC